CTIPIMKPAPLKQDCTFAAHTSTETVYTDCGGCALVTRRLGVGLPCRAVTTVPGNDSVTVTACAHT
ncbi:hypothetical protein K491DRAFT_569628, partial [Lophiostoma macrostomum CBS 122681]